MFCFTKVVKLVGLFRKKTRMISSIGQYLSRLGTFTASLNCTRSSRLKRCD